jgi:tRNA wybutosine-synthesizing protein 1
MFDIILTVVLIALVLVIYYTFASKAYYSKPKPAEVEEHQVKVFYATQTDTAKKFAYELLLDFNKRGVACSIDNVSDVDPEESLKQASSCSNIGIFIVATSSEGDPPLDSKWYFQWLEDTVKDFRIHKSLLANFKYAVFGLGNSVYEDCYNNVAKRLNDWLSQLSAQQIHPLTLGDENVVNSLHGSLYDDFKAWKDGILTVVDQTLNKNSIINGSSPHANDSDKAR